MSWVRIDDKAWSHPKLQALSPKAVKVWLFALCWSNSHQTNGRIPSKSVPLLGGNASVSRQLCDQKLWERFDPEKHEGPDGFEGWVIHDFLEFQPSKAQREAEKRASNERVRRFRERQCNGVTLEGVKRRPVPSRIEETKVSSSRPDDEQVETQASIEGQIPCPANPVPEVTLEELASHYGVPLDDIQAALKEFKTYWTVGKQSGARFSRGMWIRKFRDRCQWLDSDGKLRRTAESRGVVLSA